MICLKITRSYCGILGMTCYTLPIKHRESSHFDSQSIIRDPRSYWPAPRGTESNVKVGGEFDTKFIKLTPLLRRIKYESWSRYYQMDYFIDRIPKILFHLPCKKFLSNVSTKDRLVLKTSSNYNYSIFSLILLKH